MGSVGNSRLDFSTMGTYNFSGQKAPADLYTPKGQDEGNKKVEFRGTSYTLVPTEDWNAEEKKSYVAGYTYVPTVATKADWDKGSFFYALENGGLYHDGSQFLTNKSIDKEISQLRQFRKTANPEMKKAVDEAIKDLKDMKKESGRGSSVR